MPLIIGSDDARSDPCWGNSIAMLTVPLVAPPPPALPGAVVAPWLHAPSTRDAPTASAPSLVTFMNKSPPLDHRPGHRPTPGRRPARVHGYGAGRLSAPFAIGCRRGRPHAGLGRHRDVAAVRDESVADIRSPGGTQVAAEAMPYISHRPADCNTGRRGSGAWREPPTAEVVAAPSGLSHRRPINQIRRPNGLGGHHLMRVHLRRGVFGPSGPHHRHRASRGIVRGEPSRGGRLEPDGRGLSAAPTGLPPAGERLRGGGSA